MGKEEVKVLASRGRYSLLVFEEAGYKSQRQMLSLGLEGKAAR